MIRAHRADTENPIERIPAPADPGRAAALRSAAALLRVAGLQDPATARRVRRRLSALPGVLAVRVEPEGELVRVSFDSEQVPVQRLLDAAFEGAGNAAPGSVVLVEATW